MILYFSAEGNSKAVADRLAETLNDKAVNILSISPEEVKMEGKSLGFVFPTYSWGTPPILLNYIKGLNEKFVNEVKSKNCWIVATCGDEVALAPEMIKKVLASKSITLSGGWSIQMPNTYVLLPGFNVDTPEVEEEKIEKATVRIKEISEKIRDEKWEEDYFRGNMPWLKSKIVFPLFKYCGITPSKWKYLDSCIGCSKCAESCPKKNIRMEQTIFGLRPEWDKDCISCLSCYHICPKNAVQYGKATLKKGQYEFPGWI